MKASGTASDSPTLDRRKPSADTHGKTISSIPRKSLKDTGPEFSPDTNTSRKAVGEKTTTSRKSDGVRRRDGADEKGNTAAYEQHLGKSNEIRMRHLHFITEDVSIP